MFQQNPLFCAARRALSLVPISAAVERSNSVQGHVHSKSRNRLDQTRVNSLMKITFNRRLQSTAGAKADERHRLARTYAMTSDIHVEEEEEEEEREEEETEGEEEDNEKRGGDPWESD